MNKLIAIVFLFTCSCGVKGDPMPPEKPPEMGRGKPTYKRAVEGMAFPNLPPIEEEEDDEDEEEE